ncbi:hypothetical protein [Microbacterium rhizophilus]|uniref:hypothetical protein n=1 Tax=Microbacterium rhizophilus TaxID=3138934 RepID=UPI0031E81C3F
MSRMRALAASSALVVVASLVLTGCEGPRAAVGPSSTRATPAGEEAVASPGWIAVDDLPIAPRDAAVTAWTGEELLVFGGYVGPPCPPRADCMLSEWAADGAALDPISGEWRPLAAAPRSWQGQAEAAYANGRVYVNASSEDGELLVYDIAADEWSMARGVPAVRGTRMRPDGDRLLFYARSEEHGETPDRVLDAAGGEWSELPDDPFPPAFDRDLIPTDHGLALVATDLRAVEDAERYGRTQVALLAPGTAEWRVLPPTTQTHSWNWVATDDRLASLQLDPTQAGTVPLPSGGWQPGFAPDPQQADPWLPDALGRRFSVVNGRRYDAIADRWTALPRPDGPRSSAGPRHGRGIGSCCWAGSRRRTRRARPAPGSIRRPRRCLGPSRGRSPRPRAPSARVAPSCSRRRSTATWRWTLW